MSSYLIFPPLRLLWLALVMFACLNFAKAADPHIYLITLFGTNQVLVHFDTEANRTYELQYTYTMQCATNVTGCKSNGVPSGGWRTVYTVAQERFPNHYIVPHTRSNAAGVYRLRVTP
jgi:hypothetical protein